MKLQLLLVRHAKSSRDRLDWSDLERPLTEKGREDIVLMRASIEKAPFKPERWFCSPASRTISTAFGLTNCLENNQDIVQIKNRLYTFEAQQLKIFISTLPKSLKRVAIVGHNPALESLLESWLPESALLPKFPTLGMAWLTFEATQWAFLSDKTLQDWHFEIPKKGRNAL